MICAPSVQGRVVPAIITQQKASFLLGMIEAAVKTTHMTANAALLQTIRDTYIEFLKEMNMYHGK